MEPRRNEIDDMIVHEKMQAALEYQNEAWADGMADGIEPEIIADAAIALAMRETIRIHGEDGAEAMLESLRARMLAGEFSPKRSVQ
ncbi:MULTISPECIES: hypothetical protein [Rhizobium/Agrobacterium group]|uniref:Uncharacterized protein n=2 Tax=Rhizobium/Agrobacterium group TaxID=227290 RepID=B9JUP9_ALLAM|nr:MULTISPECIES: hypothetical protein [Rhizobium/Agrobacterium group]MCF1500894.1 hypothetical protein [Allorhizobium sp. Av2]ACM36044.1 conserved hypothetical protein [Allorhizobium ampelinum S4]KAA3519563.1 hypothetical protein DXM22_01270 [Agrobacterium vitis]KAA3532225.1 hypothetical protein DXT89_02450 [Agrobacterium vitis]MBF2716632.1 hypothetical protein [Agrobacterium vitis]